MARYKVVHGSSWDHNYCALFFETDNQEAATTLASQLGDKLADEYRVIDAYSTDFPATDKPLLGTAEEASRWLAKTKSKSARVLGNGVVLRFKLRGRPETLDCSSGKVERDGSHGVSIYDIAGKRVQLDGTIEQWTLVGPDETVIDGDIVV
jgi:hypothetical protein